MMMDGCEELEALYSFASIVGSLERVVFLDHGFVYYWKCRFVYLRCSSKCIA